MVNLKKNLMIKLFYSKISEKFFLIKKKFFYFNNYQGFFPQYIFDFDCSLCFLKTQLKKFNPNFKNAYDLFMLKLKKLNLKFFKILKSKIFSIKNNQIIYYNYYPIKIVSFKKINQKKLLKKNFRMHQKFKHIKYFMFFSIIKCLICQKIKKEKEFIDLILILDSNRSIIFKKLKKYLNSRISIYHNFFFCKKKTFSFQLNKLISFPFFVIKDLLKKKILKIFKNVFFFFFI
jgi:RNA polymerase subunit RPABC4/transcription elongation factor Spt4